MSYLDHRVVRLNPGHLVVKSWSQCGRNMIMSTLDHRVMKRIFGPLSGQKIWVIFITD